MLYVIVSAYNKYFERHSSMKNATILEEYICKRMKYVSRKKCLIACWYIHYTFNMYNDVFFFFSFDYTISPAAVMKLVVFFKSSKPPNNFRWSGVADGLGLLKDEYMMEQKGVSKFIERWALCK